MVSVETQASAGAASAIGIAGAMYLPIRAHVAPSSAVLSVGGACAVGVLGGALMSQLLLLDVRLYDACGAVVARAGRRE